MNDGLIIATDEQSGLPIVTAPGRVYPDVIFATPTLSHSFCVHYHRSIMETSWLCMAHGITTGVMIRPGDCFVDKARNKLVTDFLREFPGTPNFFFLDDDIGWPPEKVLEFIQRPDAVVAGAYPKKGEYRDFPCSLALDPNTGELIESQGLFLAIMAPTGFLRIKTPVLEKLAEQANLFEDITPDGQYASYAYIFETGRGADGKYWGEDYTFCRKVADAGYHIWIDPDIAFKHQGIRTWEDRLSNHMETFRRRAKMIHAGVDPDDIEPTVDLKEVATKAVQQQWIDKELDTAGLHADPKTRAKYIDIDAEFWPIYDLCRPYTMTSIERMFDLYKSVQYVVQAGIPGAIVECGVWQGGAMMLVAHTLKRLGDNARLLQLFDTFRGLPFPDETIDIDALGWRAEDQWKPGWAEARLPEVVGNMASTGYTTVEYIEGMVEHTLAARAVEQYALVRLDTDWYASTKVELEVLWGRIAPGGLLHLDDYGHWLGCRKAADEFFAGKGVRMERVDYSGRTIQKPAVAIEGWLKEAAE